MGDSVIRIGRVLSDNYRIERVIGRGGMATVFEASHLRLPIRVALKVITAPLDDAQEFLIRFRREAETLARLEHPHVVSVYDWNVTDDGLPYLVMELLCGEDLTQRLRKTPRLPKRLALHIFSQIAQALQAAHRHSIVHRDIKPSNIFLCTKGPLPDFVKVLDFGIAKQMLDAVTRMTRDHTLLGTPAYMAPEQARGDNQKVDERTDQFALALLLYEMLAGHAAFGRKGEHPASTMYRVLYEQPLPLADHSLYEVILRALQKDPSARFPCLSDFVDAVLGEVRPTSRQPIVSTSQRSPIPRFRLRAWSGAILLLGSTFLHGDPSAPPFIGFQSVLGSDTPLWAAQTPHPQPPEHRWIPIAPPQVVSGASALKRRAVEKSARAERNAPKARVASRVESVSSVHPMGQIQFEMVEGFPPGSSGEAHILSCLRKTPGLKLYPHRNQRIRMAGDSGLRVTSKMAAGPRESLDACLSEMPADTVMVPSLVEVKVK